MHGTCFLTALAEAIGPGPAQLVLLLMVVSLCFVAGTGRADNIAWLTSALVGLALAASFSSAAGLMRAWQGPTPTIAYWFSVASVLALLQGGFKSACAHWEVHLPPCPHLHCLLYPQMACSSV